MIAYGNYTEMDPTGFVIGFFVVVSLIIAVPAGALRWGCRNIRFDGRTWRGRERATKLFNASGVALILAAVVLMGGTWAGVRAESPVQKCSKAASARGVQGTERAGYIGDCLD